MNKIKIEKSSGNVFEDLGVANPEMALYKSELAYGITKRIKELGLTQKNAGEKLGIDQAKISAISCGRLKGFSIERLLRFLNLLDLDVNITVTEKTEKRGHGRVKVTPLQVVRPPRQIVRHPK